jgi:hypothetical protein
LSEPPSLLRSRASSERSEISATTRLAISRTRADASPTDSLADLEHLRAEPAR